MSDGPEGIDLQSDRVLSVTDKEFRLEAAAAKAVEILSRNPKGYFLMIEWDMHTDDVKRGLNNALELDKAIRSIAQKTSADTLIVFTADHSFDLRVRGGRPGEPILTDGHDDKPNSQAIRVDNEHTGEEVLAAGHGTWIRAPEGIRTQHRPFPHHDECLWLDGIGGRRQ